MVGCVRVLKCFSVLALCALMPGTAAATENALKKGNWALQFEVNGDFDLRSFEGSTFSLKKHTADRTAVRVGLDLSFRADNRVSENITNQESINSSGEDTLFTRRLRVSDDDVNSYNINLTVMKVF